MKYRVEIYKTIGASVGSLETEDYVSVSDLVQESVLEGNWCQVFCVKEEEPIESLNVIQLFPKGNQNEQSTQSHA